MPRVLSYTPPWLNRPAPGHAVFTEAQARPEFANSKQPKSGPKQLIARRGTEIFVASDNQLRWSDLVLLKEQWEEQQKHGRSSDEEETFVYRLLAKTLKAPIHHPIKQLLISPSCDYMAIATSHTIHIAILPDPSHLTADDRSPLKLKTFQLGPTAHVLERSALASILWHPFGLNGSCLVTVTEDATVRLWELDRDNRWSFDTPAIAVDLKKLANGYSSTEDFSPSKYSTTTNYSPDSFDLQVSAACFGGTGAADEDGFSSMTLWLAMRGGDVYALCPLLPLRWQAPPSVLPQLSTAAAHNHDETPSTPRSRSTPSVTTWLAEVARSAEGSELDQVQTYKRPSSTSPVPQLQGPFGFTPETEEIFDISSIYAVATSTDAVDPAVQDGFDDSQLASEKTPFGFIALATGDGLVHICLNIDGVKPKWLPSKSIRTKGIPDIVPNEEVLDLLLVESITVCDPSKTLWSTFSPAVDSRQSFFVTHDAGVSQIDTSAWMKPLADEFQNAVLSGAEVRLDVLLEGIESTVQHPIRLQNPYKDDPRRSLQTSTATNIYDSDLGNFLLTVSNGQAQAAVLETIDPEMEFLEEAMPQLALDRERSVPALEEIRPSYQPPAVFWKQSKLQIVIESHIGGRSKQIREGEIRMSTATERALLDAHRTLGQETQELNSAAADLFRRSQRMLDEFRDQLRRVRTVRDRIDSVLDNDADAYEDRQAGYGTADVVENRLQEARERQVRLSERCAELRRRVHLASGRPLTDKEIAWSEEIGRVERLTGSSAVEAEDADDEDDDYYQVREDAAQDDVSTITQRLGELRELKETLMASSRSYTLKQETDEDAMDVQSMTSSHRRPGRTDQVHAMLSRETALMEAIKEKLARLNSLGLD